MDIEHQQVIDDTRLWLERAVIGLNLCPFAKSVHVNERLRYVVSDATTEYELLQQLANELLFLQAAPPDKVETTLLIHPKVLNDFLDFNDFLEAADGTLEALEMQGDLQVASFHPDYQFEGTAPDEITNFSNRSPYPTLHLLRESSIEMAVATMKDTDAIYEANMATLQKLGLDGWRKLGLKG